MANSLTNNLIGMGLVEARGSLEESSYVLHPGVAESGRRDTNPDLAIAVDKAMRQFWWITLVSLLHEEMERTELVIDAAQRGAPYLMRRQLWDEAIGMLEQVVLRSPSPAVLDQTIPLLKRIVESSKDTPTGIISAGVLAMALTEAGQLPEAEKLQRQIIEKAVATANYRIATSTAGDLCYLLEKSGRLTEALELAEQLPEYARQGKLGPWVEIANERMRLQILSDMNFSDQGLLKQLRALYERMTATPDDEAKRSLIRPYHEREMTLGLMANLATRQERPELALDLFMQVAKSKQERGAPQLEIAQPLIIIADCLINLKRYDEAKDILFYCKPIFEHARAWRELSTTFDVLAGLEWQLEHWQQANAHQENALRYAYLLPDPHVISIAHFNLARSLRQVEPESPNAIAHRLAACVVDLQSNSGELESAVAELAADLKNFATQAASPPTSFEELCERVEQTAGVRFRELFAELPTHYSTGDEALTEALRLARIESAISDNTNEASSI